MTWIGAGLRGGGRHLRRPEHEGLQAEVTASARHRRCVGLTLPDPSASPSQAAHAAGPWSEQAVQSYIRMIQAISNAPEHSHAAWMEVGRFLLAVSTPGGALLSFQQAAADARVRGDVEAEQSAVRGQYFGFVMLGKPAEAAAAYSIIRGGQESADIPHPADLMPGQSADTAALTSDESCREMIAQAVMAVDHRPASVALGQILTDLAQAAARSPHRTCAPLHLLGRDIRDHFESRLAYRRANVRRARARRVRKRIQQVSVIATILALVVLAGSWLPLPAVIAGWFLIATVCAVGWVASSHKIAKYSHMIVVAMICLRLSLEKSTHRQAADAVLHSVQPDNDQAFVLYLRSFAKEAASTTLDYGDQADGLLNTSERRVTVIPDAHDLALEAWISGNIAPVVPVLSIASADTNLVYAPALAVPRLEVNPSSWEEVVPFLVWGAQMVVVDCAEFTPGVRFELGLIRFLGKTTQSVVVLPSRETVESLRRSGMFHRAPTPQPEQIASLGFGRGLRFFA
jgi:hypothetical protein